MERGGGRLAWRSPGSGSPRLPGRGPGGPTPWWVLAWFAAGPRPIPPSLCRCLGVWAQRRGRVRPLSWVLCLRGPGNHQEPLLPCATELSGWLPLASARMHTCSPESCRKGAEVAINWEAARRRCHRTGTKKRSPWEEPQLLELQCRGFELSFLGFLHCPLIFPQQNGSCKD